MGGHIRGWNPRPKDFKEEKVQESKFTPDRREIAKEIWVHNKLKTHVRLLYTACIKKKKNLTKTIKPAQIQELFCSNRVCKN